MLNAAKKAMVFHDFIILFHFIFFLRQNDSGKKVILYIISNAQANPHNAKLTRYKVYRKQQKVGCKQDIM